MGRKSAASKRAAAASEEAADKRKKLAPPPSEAAEVDSDGQDPDWSPGESPVPSDSECAGCDTGGVGTSSICDRARKRQKLGRERRRNVIIGAGSLNSFFLPVVSEAVRD